MPSAEHETPIALAKLAPDVLARLLSTVFDVQLPAYDHARTQDTDVRVLVPRTYRADGMTVFCDQADAPVSAGVLEVQRGRDRGKRRSWKLYVASLESELDVDVALVVYVPDPAVAAWYRDLLAASETSSLSLRPMIFTPDDLPLVVSADSALADPALTVFSVLCHGGDPKVDAAFPALLDVLRSLGPEKSEPYNDLVLAGLPEAARLRWEAFVTTTAGYTYLSESFRAAERRGRAEGEAKALLVVLDTRGVQVPDDVRDRIQACADNDQLTLWVRRAATATSIDDVIRD